jgi:hypothetical protein
VLKKAGILVAAAAAGLVALTPFAFAGDHHDAPAPVNHTNISEGNVGNDCDFGQAGSRVAQNLTGGNSLVDVAGAVTGIVTPADAQTQLGNCTNLNLSDVVDSDSNNTERTRTENVTDGSFNSEG